MRSVLVIDDEPSYRKHLKRALCEDGYRVEVAANQKEARALAFRIRPDVVIADWMLKDDVNGLELADRLREANPELRVVLITGFPAASLKPDEARGGHLELLEKPFRMEALLDAVRRVAVGEA
jgi:DNA-binding NtrC family response regulator